jgi:hypothetical protein
MGYTTYENYRNRHITIHLDGCNQIKKGGGTAEYSGAYYYHKTLADAETYAKTTDLPIIKCHFCKP